MALGWRVGVDAGAVAVNHDVVMEPTHRRQVLGVGAATIDPPHDVMHLEAIAAGTARNRARCTVTVQDEPAQPFRDHPTAPSHSEWCPLRGAGGDLNDSVAQHRFNRCLANPRPRLDHHTGLAVGGCCFVGVDEHRQHGDRVFDRGAVATGDAVEADRPQRIRPACCP